MEWKSFFKENIINGGQEYVDNNAVVGYKRRGDIISAEVEGVETFKVKFVRYQNEFASMSCNCPFAGSGKLCKHLAAVLIKAEQEGDLDDIIEEAPVITTEIANNQETEAASVPEKEELKSSTEGELKLSSEDEPTPSTEEELKLSSEEESKPAKEAEPVVKHRDDVVFTADINKAFMYALYHNHQALINSITVINNSYEFLSGLKVVISDKFGYFEKTEIGIDDIAAGNSRVIKNPEIKAVREMIVPLTERIASPITVSLISGNEEIAVCSDDVWVYSYNQWPGEIYSPELLSTFVMPNHPVISTILLSASKWLQEWTGNPSLDGYQSKDTHRVLTMAAAAYAAIQKLNIVYSEEQASFRDPEVGNCGQRVRLADEVVNTRLGNCMDLTILYASCLEAMRLHPILVLVQGHIFAGVWLVDDDFPEMCVYDYADLQKRIAEGVNEIAIVECTSMCMGESVPFDEARLIAEKKLAEYADFDVAIDVYRSRTSKIRPMPWVNKGDNGYIFEHEERTEAEITVAPQASKYINIDFDELMAGPEKNVTKQVQWERKLLDLSLRNMLINMRIKSVVPILIGEDGLGTLEDHLAEGEEFEIMGRPVEWDIHSIDYAEIETLTNLGPYLEVIEQEQNHHRLHAWYSADETKKSLTRMYRTAKTSMEENGASTFYLALGILKWSEGIRVRKDHYAPLILMPVDIKSKAGNKGFVLSLRDDEEQVNITLLEFLKQNYGMDIPGLDPIPRDEHGIDVDKILAIFRHAIMDKSGWNVYGIATIGNFSFSQFVMWNDMHKRTDELENNKIVKSLITGVVDWDNSVPESVDTGDAYLPVSVDASQLRAINMAANDVSFVLHGPPGTGKSQTITAMIANALTKGKTVLFVAEKMAALSVVQKRLAALGIGDFCLELHSNKAVKKNVLDQLKRTLDISVWGMKTEYDRKISELHRMREGLDSYMKALHSEQEFGISVRDAIDEYEAIPEQGVYLHFDKDFLGNIRRESFSEHRRAIEKYISTSMIVGNAKSHPFYGAERTDYSQSFRIELEDKVALFKKNAKELKKGLEEYLGYVRRTEPVSEKQWKVLRELVLKIANPADVPDYILFADDTDEVFDKLIELAGIKQSYDSRRQYILDYWNESFLEQNVEEYINSINGAGSALIDKKEAWDSYEVSADKCTIGKIYNEYGNAKNPQAFIGALSDMNNSLREQIESLKLDTEELCGLFAADRPVTARQWNNTQALAATLINPVQIPDFLLGVPSLDNAFVAPMDYVRRKIDFDSKKAYVCRMWNESFLSLDMGRYQLKYDEAGKKLLGKKKAYEALAAELRGFAKFDVIIEQIPVRLAEVIAFQEENRKFEALSNALMYEWRDIVEKHSTVESLSEFKEYCRKQIAENGDVLRLCNGIRNAGKYDAAVIAGNRFIKSKQAVTQISENICTMLGIPAVTSVNDWLGIRDAFCDYTEYCIARIRAGAPTVEALQQFAHKTINMDELPGKLEEVAGFIADTKKYELLIAGLDENSIELIEKYSSENSMTEYKAYCTEAIDRDGDLLTIVAKLKGEGRYADAVASGSRLVDRMNSVDEEINNLAKIIGLNPVLSADNWLGSREEFCDLIENNMPKLKDWINYSSAVRDCEQTGLNELIEKAEEGLALDKLQNVYFKSIYRALAMHAIENDPVLNRFTGTGFEQRISEYKQLEDEFISLTKEEMYYKLTHNLPTAYQSPEIAKELAVLKKAISNGARGMSIRNLFDQIPHILTRLCPCLLMSPISVSQYLTTDCDLFDIVVFDEASQLPTCKAVGVIARGKNAVIVGDPNQMPPTSFFAGNMVDEDNLDLEDLDSILDDCLALGMPSTHLKWHYRSKHESLIAFSNRKYYENSMYTFPSVNDRERRVKLVTVNGCFNRKAGRINKEEGAAVIREIRRRYESDALRNQSVGVVTFNIIQQRYIIDLLDAEYSNDLEFEKWAKSGDEPLFVKNLENVQGDERDVILFSIGFGPDEDGKLSLNFGPLNKEGGWKRLNVAISRAKSEMIVFSSMTPDMIDTGRTKAKGVEGLKGFLNFARTGEFLDEFSVPSNHTHKGIRDHICRAIIDKGYDVARDVGHSDFKVDIAVVNPFDEDEYLLGILLDGDSYKQAPMAKDRELSQMSVLSGLGWKLHRVWAIDWWDDCDRELEKIFELIEKCRTEAETVCNVEKDKGPESETITPLKERAVVKRTVKRKEEKSGKNSDFDEHDRFKAVKVSVPEE